MKYTVRLLPGADADLIRLPAFLNVKSVEAAGRAKAAILAGIDSLRELPQRGRPAPRGGYRELVVPFGRDAYVLRYRIVGDEVIVIAIRHSRERR